MNTIMNKSKDYYTSRIPRATINKNLINLVQSKQLIDSFRFCNPQKRQYTHWNYSFTNPNQPRITGTRIDHIFVSKNLKNKILHSDIIENQNYPSDHRPIFTIFKLPSYPPSACPLPLSENELIMLPEHQWPDEFEEQFHSQCIESKLISRQLNTPENIDSALEELQTIFHEQTLNHLMRSKKAISEANSIPPPRSIQKLKKTKNLLLTLKFVLLRNKTPNSALLEKLNHSITKLPTNLQPNLHLPITEQTPLVQIVENLKKVVNSLRNKHILHKKKIIQKKINESRVLTNFTWAGSNSIEHCQTMNLLCSFVSF